MKQNTIAASTRPAAKITTEVLTARFGKKPQTARAAFCRLGHWMGMVPTKLPTGGLLWDEAEADALLSGLSVKADPEKIDEHFARKTADASKVLPHIRAKSEAKAKRLAAMTGEVVQ